MCVCVSELCVSEMSVCWGGHQPTPPPSGGFLHKYKRQTLKVLLPHLTTNSLGSTEPTTGHLVQPTEQLERGENSLFRSPEERNFLDVARHSWPSGRGSFTEPNAATPAGASHPTAGTAGLPGSF